ncbi:MAG TPA: cryptochrome/photolyase family protein [Pseudobdellovibrionaceae bacterium]|nr:cryptochrome/photolyase family protein [Pseudobdellovibrionaceae bacterium]
MRLHLVLGDQLYDPRWFLQDFDADRDLVFMCESRALATRYRYHKLKLVLFFSAMREYRDELRALGIRVHYEELEAEGDFWSRLENVIRAKKPRELVHTEVEDQFFERELLDFATRLQLPRRERPSPGFLTTRSELAADPRLTGEAPRMKHFYETQRKRLRVLVDDRDQPTGGRWSFDEDNRRKLPASVEPPPPRFPQPTAHVREVQKLVAREFASHPGEVDNFWLPVRRADAREWLQQFLDERFALFGPYEDAVSTQHDFIFHSALSPLMNLGLLTADEVLREALDHAEARPDFPIASLEGFVRQIIGWREFVRGIYRHHSERQESANFWGHRGRVGAIWYEGRTGLPPVDLAIRRARHWGWTHHIERLMYLSNTFLLSERAPREVHRWFMEMYVDSADWVMGPNVYGMGLMSDGGLFATKPYICGSNYWLKMSDFKRGEWCDVIDGLYWRFIRQHREFFARNPRMSVMLSAAEKIDRAKRERLEAAAREFLKFVDA